MNRYPFLKNEIKNVRPTQCQMVPVEDVFLDYEVKINRHHTKVIEY